MFKEFSIKNVDLKYKFLIHQNKNYKLKSVSPCLTLKNSLYQYITGHLFYTNR